jgi:hypothetical protein
MLLLLTIAQTNTPDPWQLRSWQVTIVTALIAAIVALVTAIANLIQRSRDTRWKQAELARKLFDEIFDFETSNNALIMIDEFSEAFQISGGEDISVSFADIDAALTVPIKDHSNKAKFIRRSFDALFYYLERMERSIQIKVVKFDDIGNPADYFVERLALHKRFITAYLDFTKYSGALAFLERFPSWTKASY